MVFPPFANRAPVMVPRRNVIHLYVIVAGIFREGPVRRPAKYAAVETRTASPTAIASGHRFRSEGINNGAAVSDALPRVSKLKVRSCADWNRRSGCFSRQ